MGPEVSSHNTSRRAAEDTLVALGNTDLVVEAWESDGEGVVPDGIVGGDGAGEAVSVRYINRHRPCAQITAYFHVVDQRERGGDDDMPLPFHVEEMVEYYIADRPVADPDQEERWSDYEYNDFADCYATEAEAEVARDRLAEADSGEDYRWDGTSNRA